MRVLPQQLTYLRFSSISVFLDSPEEFKHVFIDGNERQGTRAMDFGSVADCLLTEPGKFEEEYIVCTVKIPTSEQQKKFADFLASYSRVGINAGSKDLASAYSNCYSTKGKSEDKIYSEALALADTLNDYAHFLARSEGKTVITEETYKEALALVNKVKANPVANKWLCEMPGTYQHKIQWSTSLIDLPIVSTLDKSIVDHKNKRALVVELKTTREKNERGIARSVRKYRYHMQADMYKSALLQYLFETTGEIYTVSHLFIFVKSSPPYQVLPVQLSDQDFQIGAELWGNAIISIRERLTANDWRHCRLRDNGGIIKLNVFPKE